MLKSGVFNFVSIHEKMTLNRLKCLRGEYFANECNACIDVCPHDAIFFRQKKMHLSEKCASCGGCIGSCPTSAIEINGFSSEEFVLSYESDGKTPISCEASVPCVGVFDRYHLLGLTLKGKSSLDIKISIEKCAECEHSKGVLQGFLDEVEITNRFLRLIGKNEIMLLHSEQKSRREVFNRFVSKLMNGSTKKLEEENTEKYVPQKMYFAAKNISEIENIDTINLREFGLFGNKKVSNACNGCNDCVLFCPSGALTSNKNDNGFEIFFESYKCLSCGICEDICKPKAIEKENFVGSGELFEKKGIFSGTYVICQDCRCGFLTSEYKASENVCPRCQFGREHTKDMFRLASDF